MDYKFSIPYNGDPGIIDIIISDYLPFVRSIYGSFGLDGFGGGRAQKSSFLMSEDDLKKLSGRLQKCNIDFNYVINSTNLLNREFTPEYLSLYKSLIKKLSSFGINTITLCNPFLIRFTKEVFPGINISASVNLKIRSLAEVKYVLGLGCNDITLHYDILKNFRLLKEIRDNTPDPINLKLILNDVYLKNCPWQKGHTRMQGAHSRSKESKTPYFSYYRNKCINIRNYYPEEIFKAMWIPPEHLDAYLKIGYRQFKLLDRLASTGWIIRALNAYIEKKYNLGLEHILGTYGSAAQKGTLPDLDPLDAVYPAEKLEAVPGIKMGDQKKKKIWNYIFSQEHPDKCGSCRGCLKLSVDSLDYPESLRDSAKRNNRIWQQMITKLEFIEKLNTTIPRRIEYKSK